LTSSLSRTLEDYSLLNESLASGKKLLAPSDDATGMSRVLDYRTLIAANDQYQQNITTASNSLNFVSSLLDSVTTTLTEVQGLVSKNKKPQDPLYQATDAALTGSLRDLLLSIANTKYSGRYVFSGFTSTTQSYNSTTYAYQGDAGYVNIPVNTGTTIAQNLPGSQAFSYTLTAAQTVTISSGRFVHYTPGAGTTVNVEIRDTDDTTVLDTFSFSNVLQMTDLLSGAISTGDTLRVEALEEPFQKYQDQLLIAQTDIGNRLSSLSNVSSLLTNNTTLASDAKSVIEDADPVETAAKLKQTEVTLQALRESASRVLSQSLFDFLR